MHHPVSTADSTYLSSFVPFHITSQRDPTTLPNSSSLCYSYIGLLSNPPTHGLHPVSLLHMVMLSLLIQLTSFLQTQQRPIHPSYHLTEPCTHVLYSLSCGYLFIFCPQPTTITSTTRMRVLERRNYLGVCVSLYCYQLTHTSQANSRHSISICLNN